MVLGIQQLVAVSRLTPGRRLMALERLREKASARPDCADLLPPIDRAVTAQRKALERADRWREASTDRSMHARGAKEADAAVDRALTGLHATLQQIARAFGPAEASSAKRLLDEVFPSGAAPLVNLPYIEQNVAVDAILHRLSTDLADAVAALSLGAWVRRLRELNDACGPLLSQPRRLSHADVVAADQAGQVALAEVVARVLGRFPTEDEADRTARAQLLEPVLDQQRELSLLRASRRRAPSRPREPESPERPDAGAGAPRAESGPGS